MGGNVRVHPAERPRHVVRQGRHVHGRQQPVVDRHEHEPAGGKRPGFLLHQGLVAGLPAAAVDPKHNRQVARAGGGVDVEDLPWRRVYRVGYIPADGR